MADSITYRFGTDSAIPANLRGKTVSGGKPLMIVLGGEMVTGVRFADTIEGKAVFAKLAGKPDLAAAVARYKDECSAEWLASRPADDADWQTVLAAREHRETAYRHCAYDDGTGRQFAAYANAERDADAALTAYKATWGDDGPSLAAERNERATDKARRDEEYRQSFVARGLD